MRRPAPADRLHTLEIPLTTFSLLMPSSGIAEISPVTQIAPVPLAPPWLLGAIAWRTLAVPVVSFNYLLSGKREEPHTMSRLVVFYPLPGRGDWEFFCLPTSAEPRPRTVDPATAVPVSAGELPSSPYLAAGLRAEGRVLAIPNLDELKKLLYP
jgi:hypothetical protein